MKKSTLTASAQAVRTGLLLCAILLVATEAKPEDAYRGEVVVSPVLKSQTDAAGKKIVYPTAGTPEVTGVVVLIPAGAETGWHVHTEPCFAYVLEGEVTVEWEDGSKRTVKAGEAFAEVVNLRHNGSNQGTVPAKLVMFVAGTTGTPIAVRR